MPIPGALPRLPASFEGAGKMRMTDSEKRILDGQEGPLKRRALELVAAYAGALGAEELCRITRAHLYAGSHFYLQIEKLRHLGVDEVISRMHFCSENLA